MAGSYGAMPDEKKMMAENDLHHLLEAKKIEMDPKRMKAAMECHAEKMKAMKAIEKDGEKAK